MNLCEKKIDAKFDEVIELFQGNEKNQYGIIYGNNIVVFIKAGLQSSCYGYENKYAKIGRLLNEKHGCSIISSSNPLGYHTDFSGSMHFIRDYAIKQNLEDYKVYYIGHSNGGSLGIINSYHFSEIKKLVCINSPLMINPHLLIQGIKEFNGEKMYLVYGSKDPSFNLINPYSELESEKVEFVRVYNADHNFSENLDFFIHLPGILLFGDELNCNNIKVHQ